MVRPIVLLSLCAAAACGAAEAEVVNALDRGPPPKPGHEIPAAPAEAMVLRFDWDTYATVIVVGEGVGMVKPAWVGTWDQGVQGAFVVAYRASAFRDARGRLHIDARNANDVGPQSQGWSPDSFAVGTQVLWSLDDRGSGHQAAMGEIIPATVNQALWRRELQRVQALVEGGL